VHSRVLILAGGGGHTGYAYALAQALHEKVELHFLVPEGDSLSKRKLSKFGKVDSLIKPRGPKTPMYEFIPRLIFAFFQSLGKVARKYNVVVSTGSNFCVPPAMMAWTKRIPVVNIESCVRFTKASITAKTLRPFSRLTALQWDEQKSLLDGVTVGPLLPRPEKKPWNGGYILITGGTHGHKQLFDVVAESNLRNVILQTGRVDPTPYKERHPEWKVIVFTERFDELIAGADVVISHFGLTPLEATAYRKPTIIVLNPEWKRTVGLRDAEVFAKKLNAVLLSEVSLDTLLNAINEAKKKEAPTLLNGAQILADKIMELCGTKVCMIAMEPDKMPRLEQEKESLTKLGYDVKVFKPKLRFRFKPRVVSAFLRYSVYALQALFSKADIYHVHNNPDVGFLAMLKRGKFVYDVRNPWGEEVYDLTGHRLISKICTWIERTSTKHADIVIVANHKLAERAWAWGAKKVFVVPNYPTKEFKPTINPSEMRKKYDLERKKVVVFAGNFEKVECALDLVKMVPEISKEVPEFVLIMIGDGTQKASIEEFIKKNKMEQSVLLVGRIPRLEVPNWLAVADVIAVPRNADIRSAPYYCPESVWKVTEALFLGKHVVSCPVGGFIDSPYKGVKTAPLEQFHEAIVETLKNPPKVEISKNFVWDYSEEQLRVAYEEIE